MVEPFLAIWQKDGQIVTIKPPAAACAVLDRDPGRPGRPIQRPKRRPGQRGDKDGSDGTLSRTVNRTEIQL